ncbi:45765_t:CDS:2, partial [Gigaspora margarita]
MSIKIEIADTLPLVIITAVSSISIILQAIQNRRHYFEIPSHEVPDDILIMNVSQRFKHENNLNFDMISPGILAICWFYALTISIITLSLKSRRWRWILNAYLTAFFFTSSLCSLLAIIKLNDFYKMGEIIEKLTVVCNFIFSVVAVWIAITTPMGPPIFQNGRSVCAIEYCSIWHFITFASAYKLIVKAYKQKTFNDDDLDLLPFACQAKSLYNAFKKTRGNKLLPENGSLKIGYIYIFGLLVSTILLRLTLGQNWYWSSTVLFVGVKGMLNSEIYSKSLRRIDSHVST